VNFYRNSTHRFTPNFSSNSILNLDKFLWGKLFLISSSFYLYFYLEFWSQLGLPFDQISLNYFKLIQINAKPYCSYGLGHPLSSRSPATPCRRQAADEHATVPSRARAAGRAGQLPRWAGLPGRGPADVSADHAWQATVPPWALASGRFRPGTVPGILNVFLIVLNHRN
jgi:hypothetical protein